MGYVMVILGIPSRKFSQNPTTPGEVGKIIDSKCHFSVGIFLVPREGNENIPGENK